MKLSKAIEMLSLTPITGDKTLDKDMSDAMKLGSEALDQLRQERKQKVGFWRDRLPSETKE